MRSRNWLMTLNNPDEFTQDYLENFFKKTKAKYVCGQLEKGAEGTLHLQFFANYPDAKAAGGIKTHDKRLHLEIVKVNNGADTYCMKEDTRVDGPWEFGEKPVKRNSKTDWEEVFQNAKDGNLDAIPADIKVKHYGNLKKIEKDHLVVTDHDDLRGEWIWGRSGVGKSRIARQENPDFYPKLCNKWWDGYQGQATVIMDDLGPDHECLGQQLKIWADRYGCILETKGGALVSKYIKFIVTSQYSPEEIFIKDSRTLEAIRRRFKVRHVIDPIKDIMDSH